MQTMELHFDKGRIEDIEKTQEGFLRLTGTIAKVGWLDYYNKDGSIRREYVPEETLFDPDHLESIGGQPLTLNHPDVQVNPQNYKKYSVGSTGTKVMANTKSKTIDVVFIVNDQKAIDAITKDGIRELSMGYQCLTTPNQDGTFTQVKRICNHNAIVEKARCEGAKLHLDGWFQQDEDINNKILTQIRRKNKRIIYSSKLTLNHATFKNKIV